MAQLSEIEQVEWSLHINQGLGDTYDFIMYTESHFLSYSIWVIAVWAH